MNNNKLIAEFMGLSIKEGVCYYTDADDMFPMGIEVEEPYLPYTSWDWLMPVIREVLMTIDIEDVFQQAMFDSDELKANILDCDIDGAYKEVVELIKQIKTYRDGEY